MYNSYYNIYKMWQMCLALYACALLIATKSTYGQGPWNHVSLIDAIQFAVDHIEDKFTNASKTIIPHPNIPDSPLNKFVDALTIEAHIKPILLQNANVELNFPDHPEYTNKFVTVFIERFTYPFLVDAMQQRRLLLDQLKKERIDEELKLVTDIAEDIVKSLVFDKNDPETSVQNLVTHIKKSSMTDEIKSIFKYPVVREEVIRVMSKDFANNDSLIQTVMKTILPFIREGIQNADNNAVNLHSSEAAINRLKAILVPQYISLMKDAILKANLLNAVLNESYQKEYKIVRDMVEEYALHIRKAISIFYVTANDSNYPNSLSTEMMTVIRRSVLRDLKGTLQAKLNVAMGIAEPYIVFDDHDKITEIRSILLRKINNRIYEECDAYSKLHQNFSKENRTALAEFAVESLKTEYKDIQPSEIEVLKRNIPNIKNLLEEYYYNSTADINVSDRMKSFQNNLQKKAINVFGFLPGMFIYSKPYYDVLENVFPQSFDSLDSNHSNLHSKFEL